MNKLHRFIPALLVALVAQPAFAASAEVTPEFVARLVSPYIKVQTALAADDLPAAKSTAGELLAVAAKGSEHKAITGPAAAITSAPDMAAARASFLKISQELIALVDKVGAAGQPDLFVAHCPMAFSGKGADWLQTDKTINNPYYGASMLRCGSIKREVGVKPASGRKRDAHH